MTELWYFHGESEGQGWASFRVLPERSTSSRVVFLDDLDEPPREKSIARSLLVDGAGYSRAARFDLHTDERYARIVAAEEARRSS